MRLNPTLIAVPPLLLILSWSLIGGLNSDQTRLDRAAATLGALSAAESDLHRDILSARAGLLRDYDPLVHENAMIDAEIGRLRATGIAGPKTQELSAVLKQQERLTEDFKTDNALLQNALVYFGLFSNQLESSEQSGALAPAAARVAASVLRLTLDTSPISARDLQERLDELSTQAGEAANRAADADTLQGLLSYGRLVQTLLPETDGVVKAIFRLPQDQRAADALSMIKQEQQAARVSAMRYHVLLYAASLLLLGCLIYLGQQLRRRIAAQQRRTAFEQLIARISMRFVAARGQQIDRDVEHALGELAGWVGADRAYFIQSGNPTCLHGWTGPAAGLVPDWLSRTPDPARTRDAGAQGIRHVPDASRLAPGPLHDELAAAGVRGWVSVAGTAPDGDPCLLGFDFLGGPIRTDTAEFGILRVALDTLANAIGRDLLEQDRAQLQARVQRARRMEMIAALTSGIAHNFNNIVGAILGYAEMGEAMPQAQGPLAQNLAGIRQAAERARDLVDQLMRFGRRCDAHPRPVFLRALLAETRSQLEVSLPSGIRLVVQDVPEEAVVSGDPAQLQQVVVNLCNNAAQSMDGKGTVEVVADLQEISHERPLSHGRLTAGSWVRVSVRDAGRGIDATTLEHVFEPFFTTRRTGNGLGLATVREIVNEHAGALHVASAPGMGSLFEVWLPRLTTAALEASAVSPPAPTPSVPLGRGETVLIVNDQRERLLRDEDVLAALGYEPVGFTRVEDVFSAYRETPDRFDVFLISHISEPTPLELATGLHGIAPHVPILLAAASIDAIGAEAARIAGVSDIIRCPLNSAELASAVALHVSSASQRKTRSAEVRVPL